MIHYVTKTTTAVFFKYSTQKKKLSPSGSSTNLQQIKKSGLFFVNFCLRHTRLNTFIEMIIYK